ncbi:MAG: MBL fold metallo-hydrolase [Phycisphaerae bacterium]|nr:MBL fold metallo-hydrolase [Phycisphaerae bacterium]
MTKLHFLGANRQVTGSCYLLEHDRLRLLIDCGMYQEREFLSRNWAPLAVPPGSINAVLLTHAHLDHCGLLPRLVHDGFKGKIHTTSASRDLAKIILLDAGEIQQEDAAYKRRRHRKEGRSGRFPEAPLFTPVDARKVFPRMRAVPYEKPLGIGRNVRVTFHDAGHILGSAMLKIEIGGDNGGVAQRLLFSGDVGPWNKPLLRDPTLFEEADYVVVESTYGDRNHPSAGDVEDQLAAVINETVEKGGNILIPTFAVERSQEVMYHISRLIYADRVPHVLGFLDSPVGVDATYAFRKHPECLDEEAARIVSNGERLFVYPGFKLVTSVDESKAINRIRGSCIILAGSGMCTAGRIKHHLTRNIDRPESAIVFVGYQAHGTLGRQILDGAHKVRIHGREFPVRARIVQIHGLSGHADQGELLRWVGNLQKPPRKVFVTHGEEQAAMTLAEEIRKRFDFETNVPQYRDEVHLD